MDSSTALAIEVSLFGESLLAALILVSGRVVMRSLRPEYTRKMFRFAAVIMCLCVLGCSRPIEIRDDAPSPTMITVRNTRDAPVSIVNQTGCTRSPIKIARGGRFLALYRGQTPSCVQTQSDAECHQHGYCASPPTLQIAPGETRDYPWDGREQMLREMEAKAPNCGNECVFLRAVSPGPVEVRVEELVGETMRAHTATGNIGSTITIDL